MKLGLSIGYSRAHLHMPVTLVQRAEEFSARSGAIAARTRHVRHSSDGCLLPLNHPLRLVRAATS